MPRVSPRSTSFATSTGDRVFADDTGRLWSAAHSGEAVVFTCITDGRDAGRALLVNLVRLDASIDDETLRAWLDAAPRIGTLP